MVLFITLFCILMLCSSFLNLMFFLFISLVSYIQSQLTWNGTCWEDIHVRMNCSKSIRIQCGLCISGVNLGTSCRLIYYKHQNKWDIGSISMSSTQITITKLWLTFNKFGKDCRNIRMILPRVLPFFIDTSQNDMLKGLIHAITQPRRAS